MLSRYWIDNNTLINDNIFVANRCPPPPSIPNTTTSPLNVSDQAVLIYRCGIGYVMMNGESQGNIQCMQGSWVYFVIPEDEFKCVCVYTPLRWISLE